MVALLNSKSYMVGAFVVAVLACQGSTLAQTPEDADPRSTEERSRIHPDYLDLETAKNRSVMKLPAPTNNTTTMSIEGAEQEETLPPTSTTSELIDSLRLCTEVVKPNLEVNLAPLVNGSWGYTRPVSRKTALGQFEKVDYINKDLTISLQDFGDRILCRVAGLITGPQQMENIRSAIISSLGATSISTTPGYEAIALRMKQNIAQTDIANVFIKSEHTIEIASVESDLSKSGIVDANTVTVALLSTSTNAAAFRAQNAKILAEEK